MRMERSCQSDPAQNRACCKRRRSIGQLEAGEEAQWRNRHFAWVLALAEASFEPLRGPQQRQWFDRIESELDNIRAAMTWAIDQKLPDAAFEWRRTLPPWVSRSHTLIREAREWLSRLLERFHPTALRTTEPCAQRARPSRMRQRDMTRPTDDSREPRLFPRAG